MSRVDFYVLDAGDEAERLLTACRIVEKAWQSGLRVWVTTRDDAHAEQVDRMLWTFRQSSFVPHEVSAPDAPPDAHTPPVVRITTRARAQPRGGVQVNLADEALEDPALAERIAEIIPATPDGRSAGRERYRAYRAAGCELTTHNLP